MACDHHPVDIEFQHNGPSLLITAICDFCGAALTAYIEGDDWDVHGARPDHDEAELAINLQRDAEADDVLHD